MTLYKTNESRIMEINSRESYDPGRMRGKRIAHRQKILKKDTNSRTVLVESKNKNCYWVHVADNIAIENIHPGRYCNVDLSYKVTELEGYHVAAIVVVL